MIFFLQENSLFVFFKETFVSLNFLCCYWPKQSEWKGELKGLEQNEKIIIKLEGILCHVEKLFHDIMLFALFFSLFLIVIFKFWSNFNMATSWLLYKTENYFFLVYVPLNIKVKINLNSYKTMEQFSFLKKNIPMPLKIGRDAENKN